MVQMGRKIISGKLIVTDKYIGKKRLKWKLLQKSSNLVTFRSIIMYTHSTYSQHRLFILLSQPIFK